MVSASVYAIVVFPGELFNRTLKENYNRIGNWLTFIGGPLRPVAKHLHADGWRGVTAVTALTAGLYALTEAESSSPFAAYLGTLAGLLVVTIASGLAAVLYLRQRGGGGFRAFPGALVFAAVTAMISLVLHLEPGYVYGLVFGYEVKQKSTRNDGVAAALSGASILIVSVTAWLGWAHLPGGDSLLLASLHTMLRFISIAGVETVIYGMLPLQFLEGAKVLAWNPLVWAVLIGLGVVALGDVLFVTQRVFISGPLSSALAPVIGFGAFSIAFWGLFRFGPPRVPFAVRWWRQYRRAR
jgi:hypothetical protein